MTELGQVEIKRRLLSGVVDCELLSDTYELISALQAEILELKATKVALEDKITNINPSKIIKCSSRTIKPSIYKVKRERGND